uniref:Dishevelled HduDvl n=1 Tax=Halisarca dujardinii TaxID=2583056 RepID=A0A8F8AQA7_HALDU|nr:dishevelled HduDvl [Halisarca dujardinii]
MGISIMGQSAEDGVGGIFVGSIMNGGAVAADGRIQAGDLILNVNDYDFSNLTNEEAVKVLRDVVQASGPVTITVARPTYEGLEEMPTFEPRNEPIQPMDPAMWLHQTQSHQQKPLQFHHGPSQLAHGRSPTSTTLTSDSGSQATSNSMPEADRDLVTKLTLATSINLVARAMAATNSGLERKDHKWLKMTIPNSFLGANAVDWLFTNVEGFIDRRHAKKYCSLMLKDAYIKHTVNKVSFSEQCYYVFGDIFSTSKQLYKTPSELEKALGKMSVRGASSDSGDADTIAAGELPSVVPWSSEERLPPAYSDVRSSGSESGHGSGKIRRTGTPDSSGSGNNYKVGRAIGGPLTRDHRVGSIMSSASTDFTSVSQQRPGSHRRMPDVDQISIISSRSLAQMRGMSRSFSRNSFQVALERNPCEYFIDYM